MKKIVLLTLVLLAVAVPSYAAQLDYRLNKIGNEHFADFVKIYVRTVPADNFSENNRDISLNTANNYSASVKSLPVGEYEIFVTIFDSRGAETDEWEITSFANRVIVVSEDQVLDKIISIRKNSIVLPSDMTDEDDPFNPSPYAYEEDSLGQLIITSARPDAPIPSHLDGKVVVTPTPGASNASPKASDDGESAADTMKKDFWKSLILGLSFSLIFVGVVFAWRKIRKMRGGGFKD